MEPTLRCFAGNLSTPCMLATGMWLQCRVYKALVPTNKLLIMLIQAPQNHRPLPNRFSENFRLSGSRTTYLDIADLHTHSVAAHTTPRNQPRYCIIIMSNLFIVHNLQYALLKVTFISHNSGPLLALNLLGLRSTGHVARRTTVVH